MLKILKVLISIILIINTILFTISFSISFTIIFRPFYYWHITHLKIDENSNYSYEEIKKAYDDVMDYCIYNKKFKTGNLNYSEAGKNHFKDCKKLFIINFIILGLSTITMILKLYLFKSIKILGFNPSFYSSCIILAILIFISIIVLNIGFEELFTKSHSIIFYNKDNWIFDPKTDEIIKILPLNYFRNCGILIVSIISTISITNIIKEIIIKKRKSIA